MLVIYDREAIELDIPDAVEVRAIQGRLKSCMGIHNDAVALVNGVEIPPAELVQPDSTVEFVVKVGHKEVGRVWTPEEYCHQFNLTRRELDLHIEKGLRVMQLTDGTIRITETAVDEFIGGMNGNGDGAYLAVIANSLKRLADHFIPPPADIIGTDYIADKLGCTKVWVAKMAADGIIPRNALVPGTGNGKVWKFYRSRIDPWIEMR